MRPAEYTLIETVPYSVQFNFFYQLPVYRYAYSDLEASVKKMSLVAYGGSDEENSSEDEVENPKSTLETRDHKQRAALETSHSTRVPVASSSKGDGHISDEEDYEAVSSSSNLVFSDSLEKDGAQDINSTSAHFLSNLPAPQKKKEASEQDVIEENALEDEVKPKASEIANAPKPPGKKAKQPVKISIPALEQPPSDEPVKKTLMPSSKKSGLFSLLPAPIHSAKKEMGRSLIPHTLTKRPAPPKPQTVKPAPTKPSNQTNTASNSSRMSHFNALTGYDSDSDEEMDNQAEPDSVTNFFSLDSSSKLDPPISVQGLQSEEISSSRSENHHLASLPTQDISLEGAATSVPVLHQSVPSHSAPSSQPWMGNDVPLDFGSSDRLKAWAQSSSHLQPVGPASSSHDSISHYSQDVYQQTLPTSSQYNLAEQHNAAVDAEASEVSNEDLKMFMGEKEFQRLAGKRKRGLAEDLSFVDANADDVLDPSQLAKHLTEETDYVSHKSQKDNAPTSQQRRKKQITYLAHQAKEKELELKNQWALNRQTKQQTQSKYGF